MQLLLFFFFRQIYFYIKLIIQLLTKLPQEIQMLEQPLFLPNFEYTLHSLATVGLRECHAMPLVTKIIPQNLYDLQGTTGHHIAPLVPCYFPPNLYLGVAIYLTMPLCPHVQLSCKQKLAIGRFYLCARICRKRSTSHWFQIHSVIAPHVACFICLDTQSFNNLYFISKFV